MLGLGKCTALLKIEMFLFASFFDVLMMSFACRYGVHVSLNNLLRWKVNVSSKEIMAVMYMFCNFCLYKQ